ncbi:MAG: leucyl aminopeptidase [Hyphomicrobiaceae bacterium]
MPLTLDIAFAGLTTAPESTSVLLTGAELALGTVGAGLDKMAKGGITAAARAADFKGKAKAAIELLAPAGLDIQRLVLLGCGAADDDGGQDWVALGGVAYAQIAARKAKVVSLIIDDAVEDKAAADIAADLAMGALLRSYTFKKYQTKATEANGNGKNGPDKLVILTANPAGARAAFVHAKALAEGVALARDLVNEPANILDPIEFATRAQALTKVGVEVEILDVSAMEALKMGALLGVGQGSVKPSRVVVMQWHGAKAKRSKPLCFVGKGVTFDTGGISIKPAAGMEDMKGDMGGAACVTGLMHALAARKAPVNVVGLIGLVENMPSGSAQRPGDIVTSMSGQTIEVLNTDAEGRLVLADVLWYAQDRFKPKFVIDLATLTGAIMVALGKEYAGMFSNDDKLSADLHAAGEATGDKVWRMPLAKAYDKLIDSKNADMKNIGGRFGGAITAAQFLQRFIHKGTPWAHLDVAGVAMDSNKTDISQTWASGWGVRLLDRLVADHHEKPEK